MKSELSPDLIFIENIQAGYKTVLTHSNHQVESKLKFDGDKLLGRGGL